LEAGLSHWVSSVVALVAKDIRCELRTRYGLNALVLFAIITLVVVGLTAGQELLSPSLHASLIWIIVLFSSMQALASSFIKEEESKTAQTLRVFASPSVVFVGKLLFSMILLAFLLLILIPLYIVLMDVDLQSPLRFILCMVLGSFGLASATTIIAAMVSKATVKGALFAVLSFPLLLPVLLPSIAATEVAFMGGDEMWGYLRILIAYPIVVVTLSYLLFEYVWNE
jgi:heme exporter protein B